jgi:hypothetical protein
MKEEVRDGRRKKVFTGGFNFKLWSMLDTALMIQSIGVTALVVVLDEAKHRRLAFRVAIILYLLAVLDMGINVLISGVAGWRKQPSSWASRRTGCSEPPESCPVLVAALPALGSMRANRPASSRRPAF